MKIKYYVKQTFSGIEEIDTDVMEYQEYSKQWYDCKTFRYYNFNLVFNKREEALDFCLKKLREDRDKIVKKLELQTNKISNFLSKYEWGRK